MAYGPLRNSPNNINDSSLRNVKKHLSCSTGKMHRGGKEKTKLKGKVGQGQNQTPVLWLCSVADKRGLRYDGGKSIYVE